MRQPALAPDICAGKSIVRTQFDTEEFDHLAVETGEAQVTTAVTWWEELPSSGREGMVMKPSEFVCGKKGRLQTAIKWCGLEVPCIIYGPDYTMHEKLEWLSGLGLDGKSRLALRAFALVIEAQERLVSGEPLRRVH